MDILTVGPSDPLTGSLVSTAPTSTTEDLSSITRDKSDQIKLEANDQATASDTKPAAAATGKSGMYAASEGSSSPSATGPALTGGDGLRTRKLDKSSTTLEEPLRRNSIGSGLTLPKTFASTVVLDGSKLILRLAKNNTFVIDNPCKVLLASPQIRLERPVAWQTNGTCTEQENTIVIDCGLLCHHFVPIPLAHYGTVYTRDGTVHVTVGSTVRRAKVHSRNLPYRTCNKFHCVSILESETAEEEAGASATGWFIERQNTNTALASIDPAQAVKLIKQLASDPKSGVVYIRADDSLVRYRLGPDEKVELHSGRVVAWTIGVRFEQTNYCCCRFVTAVHGEGTVWVHNSRRGSVTSPGI